MDEGDGLRDEHGQTIPEGSNNKRLGNDFLALGRDGDFLPSLDRKRDVELDTRPRRLLGTSVSLVDDFERLLHERLGLEACLERGARDRGGELTMDEDVGVATDRGSEVRVDGRRESVVAESVACNRTGAEVLGGEHAASGHDSNEGVKRWEVGVLCSGSVTVATK